MSTIPQFLKKESFDDHSVGDSKYFLKPLEVIG